MIDNILKICLGCAPAFLIGYLFKNVVVWHDQDWRLWFNSKGRSDAIWKKRSNPTFFQVK